MHFCEELSEISLRVSYRFSYLRRAPPAEDKGRLSFQVSVRGSLFFVPFLFIQIEGSAHPSVTCCPSLLTQLYTARKSPHENRFAQILNNDPKPRRSLPGSDAFFFFFAPRLPCFVSHTRRSSPGFGFILTRFVLSRRRWLLKSCPGFPRGRREYGRVYITHESTHEVSRPYEIFSCETGES